MTVSPQRILFVAASFVLMTLFIDNLPADVKEWAVPLILVAVFIQLAIKLPPVAIALLLYVAITSGGWLILLAAPGTMLLARRYQRMRQQIDLNPVHIRRTVLLAAAALVAVLPFLASAVGPWSNGNRAGGFESASPLTGSEGALQRFARWLGFGDGGNDPGALFPQDGRPPTPAFPPTPDDSFNWWIVVAIVAILAVLAALLIWWMRRTPGPGPLFAPATAAPLARLEAVGERVGRPRARHEGAITYGQILARKTKDARLGAVGPLVSQQVYESPSMSPGRVESNLISIEAAPPPAPPEPSFSERMSQRADRLPFTPGGLLLGAAVLAFLIVALWLIVPRLGELEDFRFASAITLTQLSF